MKHILTVLFASTVIVIGFATPALAHHNTVAVEALCDQETGDINVTWSVTNSEADKTETITASTRESAIAVGTVIDEGATYTSTESFPGDSTETLSLQVSAEWSNGATNTSNEASVTLEGDCEEPEEPEPTPTPPDKEPPTKPDEPKPEPKSETEPDVQPAAVHSNQTSVLPETGLSVAEWVGWGAWLIFAGITLLVWVQAIGTEFFRRAKDDAQ